MKLKIPEFICIHSWKYNGDNVRKCKRCSKKEVLGKHVELIPAGLGVMTIVTNRWMKDQ